MNLRETYNRIAEDWYRHHKQDDTWWVNGIDKFVSYLKPGSLVLDIGCGGGTKSKHLIVRGLKVIGIDFSEKMIEIAKREVPGGEFQVMDMQEVASLEENFDGIFLQAVLLHVKKDAVVEVLRGLLEKLKKGGFMYVAVKEKRSEGMEEEMKREENYGYPYERFFSYFTLDEMKKYLGRLGVEIIYENITLSKDTRWIQVICKK